MLQNRAVDFIGGDQEVHLKLGDSGPSQNGIHIDAVTQGK